MSNVPSPDLLEGLRGFLFDTNTLWEWRRVEGICVEAHRRGMVVALCSLVHGERTRQERIHYGTGYSQETIDIWMEENHMQIISVERRHAEQFALDAATRYPTENDWYAYKRQRCIDCLGLQDTSGVKGKGQTCGAPVDWFIAATAAEENLLLVTADRGPEFASVKTATLKEVEQRLGIGTD
jgi:PIN domain nuclease of toxin-antitoxin system